MDEDVLLFLLTLAVYLFSVVFALVYGIRHQRAVLGLFFALAASWLGVICLLLLVANDIQERRLRSADG